MPIRWIPFVLLALAGCGSLRPAHSVGSVESVLRRTEDIGRQVEAEENAVPRKLASTGPSFQPPLRKIAVSSPFGRRHGKRHEGVDLRAETGTPIYAAERGIVAYAGDGIDGYGLAVIIRHVAGFATLYAHASRLLVKVGDRIARGSCVAYSGKTGHASGPHLHFEIRNGYQAVNPTPWITGRKPASRR